MFSLPLHPMPWLTDTLLLASAAVGIVAAGGTAYSLTLLGGAFSVKRSLARSQQQNSFAPSLPVHPPRLLVVIPAHDEELVLVATLDGLARQQYPASQFGVVVIADNCRDRTAGIARSRSGVLVLERTDTSRRGKGFALAWAFEQLLSAKPGSALYADAYAIVDADTEVAPDFLAAMSRHLGANPATTHRAIQGRYGVLNSGEGWRAGLMSAAFDLFNHVRPLGRERLGLSAGLKGNGMIFTRSLLARAPWRGDSITEDIDYGLDLLLHHGVRVEYAPDAVVRAQMPVTAEQATSQRERWERGRRKLKQERALPLIREGIRRRDIRLIESGIDLLAPPLGELVGLHLVWLVLAGAVSAAAHSLLALIAPVASLTALALYILLGLRAAGAPLSAYMALARAPFYLFWKLWLRVSTLMASRLQRKRGEDEWVRTQRHAMGATPPVGGGSPS